MKAATEAPGQVALYARVSSNEGRSDLDRQVTRLLDFATAKGMAVARSVTEIAVEAIQRAD